MDRQSNGPARDPVHSDPKCGYCGEEMHRFVGNKEPGGRFYSHQDNAFHCRRCGLVSVAKKRQSQPDGAPDWYKIYPVQDWHGAKLSPGRRLHLSTAGQAMETLAKLAGAYLVWLAGLFVVVVFILGLTVVAESC